MLFSSYEFIFVFLPVAVAGYWLLVRTAGTTAGAGWLLLASAVFYAYGSFKSLAVIAPSIVLNYLIAILLRKAFSRKKLRATLFTTGILINLLFLGYFKYKNFFLDTANTVLATSFDLEPLILPLGISFITFQKIAFLSDVYSGQVKTLRFLDFVLFALFFPRVIAGPIVHYHELMPQLSVAKSQEIATNVIVGASLFAIGLFKKAVIADSAATFVPLTFAPPAQFADHSPTLISAWVSVLAYTFQLYFDFSGYSDMALGVARMFGVRLPMNFNSPLKASSIVEFWNRWHITLTRFLTAYIYTPVFLHLTRLRPAKRKPTLSRIWAIAALSTLITMTLSGLWHGAGWQFVVWGVLHGVYLLINQSWRMLRPRFWSDQATYERIMKPLGFVLTFLAVVVALVFFRANSISSALSILAGMAGLNGILPHGAQVLQNLGFGLHWSGLKLFQSATPILWIVALFVAVTVLPNSLEIFRRFQPALDFSDNSDHTSKQQVAQSVAGQQRAVVRSATWAVIGQEGISFTRFSATIAALMTLLGLLAVNRSAAFLYGQF